MTASSTRRRIALSDILWGAAAFALWLVLLLWLPFLTQATLTRFTAGALRLAVYEGAVMGVAVFVAVRFGGAPRAVWVGVAIPAILALVMLPVLYFGPGAFFQTVSLGWYLYGALLPSAVSCAAAFVGSTLPRRTPDWSLDD